MWCKVLPCLLLLTLIKAVDPATVWSRQDVSAVLPCSVSLPPLDDPALLEASWTTNGSALVSHGNNGSSAATGYSWDTSLFLNGTFSLTLSSTTLGQQGEYDCQVYYNSTELYSTSVTLGIEVPPSLSLISSVVVIDAESELLCRAEGFNPPSINFTWTRGSDVIGGAALTAVDRSPGGLYHVTGGLRVFPSQEDQNATYGCEVTHSALDRPIVVHFQLSFVYRPSVRLSTLPSPSRSDPLTLACDLQGFYPAEVSVSWLQNGSVLPDPLPSEPGPDGTYRTRRLYTLSPAQRELAGQVGCEVRQPGLSSSTSSASAPLSELDPVAVSEPVLNKSAKASVALMCISLVLVFLLCFGFSWRRMDEKQKSLTVSGVILPPRVLVGQKGRVTLSIEGRRVDRVQTAWYLNDTLISDTSLRVSEKGPLLPPGGDQGYYKLHAPRPLHSTSGTSQQMLSSLSFIPQISLHKGAVFKCQVSYVGKEKVVAERVSEKFTIFAAPEVSEIQLTEAGDDKVVTLTVQASHFHPDVITFRWFCQGGELSPVASQAASAPRPDAEGFFSALSQCKLPRGELERGGTKVWVSVHHSALKNPVTRETRGFIKTPKVSEIVSSASCPDQPMTLGCDITGFYPPDITVTWLKLGAEEGEEEDDREEEVLPGGEVWGPVQTHPGVYRASASLRREGGREGRGRGGLEGGREERGRGGLGGVRCRVEHCSLEEPIERRWKNIHIAAPSIPPSLSVGWTSEGVGVFSLALTGGHPRATLLWAAGGATLSALQSNETEGRGGDGQKELRSVCALERSSRRPSLTRKQVDRGSNGHALRARASVSDRDLEGIEFIDEKVDGDNNNVEPEKKTKQEVASDSEEEMERGDEALHINQVNVRRGSSGGEREPLRVTVEVSHPALALPQHLTWTEPNTEVWSSL